MYYFCFLYKGTVQTFCLQEETSLKRIPVKLPGFGTIAVGNGVIQAKGVQVMDVAGCEVAPLIEACHETDYTLSNNGEMGLMMTRRINIEELLSTRFCKPMEASIGRDSRNSIVYRDHFMSGSHGYFYTNSYGELTYQDKSTNGTVYNGKLIRDTEVRLHDGDRLLFPPLLYCCVLGNSLFMNRPRGMLSCALKEFVRQDERGKMVMIYSMSAGVLSHIVLPNTSIGLAEFRKLALKNVSPDFHMLLEHSPFLLDGKTKHPVLTDSDLQGAFARENVTAQ